LDRIGAVAWARHWPLTFLAFSGFILVFANPDHWPLGSAGFLESMQSIEVVQHWLAAFVVCGLGVFEWRARQTSMAGTNLPFVFPMLCIAGGIVLLTHSHEIVELKREFLVQSTHVAMGLLAVIVGCARWLELRLTPPHDRAPAFAWVASIMLVGLILLFYITPELPTLE
jgi:putative copper resistance protein D